MTTILRRLRSESGAELIEMAMVTPILLLIVGGIVDFGFLFRAWQNVTNAAREGARVGVLPAYGCDAANPDIQSRVDAYMSASGITGSYTVENGTQTISTGAGTFTAAPVVKARITYPADGGVTLDVTKPIQWTSVVNAQAYYLYVGSTPGGKDLVNSDETKATT